VEDWGSKVEKQLKLQPGTFLSVKHSSKKTAKYVNAIQLDSYFFFPAILFTHHSI
jgi:hypothetical protein